MAATSTATVQAALANLNMNDINRYPSSSAGAMAYASSRQPTRSAASGTLRKESDYNVIRPIKSVAASKPTSSTAASSKVTAQTAPSASAQTQKTPQRAAPAKKTNKILCDTPPVRLHDKRHEVSYHRGDQLGQGGFARCFLVQNDSGEYFASKTVSKKSLVKENVKRKFLGEIHVHKMMDHPNIVRFVECFEDTANVYVILELCSNKSLMEMVKARQRLTEPEARYFMLQILGAIKYMHSKRVIHRDLKLGNIFLDEDMNIKIGDFGLAAALVSDDDRKTTMCGTPNYIAPEVLDSKESGGHGMEVDLWSVGIILYAMLTGKPPFAAKTLPDIYEKVKMAEYQWPADLSVSQEAKDVVASLLTKDPKMRPSIDDVASAPFFTSGILPASIPASATTKRITSMDLRGNAPEIKNHYYEVARKAGVGRDELGRPFPPVGKQAGKSIQQSTAVKRRPTIPPVENNKENNKPQNNKVAALKDEPKELVLPETLSPRDGHARMRNAEKVEEELVEMPPAPLPSGRGGLEEAASSAPTRPAPSRAPRRMPSARSLATSSASSRRAAAAEEESRATSVSSASSSSSMRTAVEEQAPTRRSSAYSRAAISRAAAERATRSLQRAGSMAELQSSQEGSSGSEKAEEARRPVEPAEPRRLTSRRSTRSLRSTTEESAAAPAPRPYATRSSRRLAAESEPIDAGVSLPKTRSSVVLEDLHGMYTALRGIIKNRAHEKPTTPDVQALVRSSHPATLSSSHPYIVSWVDYSNASGVGYMLSSGAMGTLYNDATHFFIPTSASKEGVFSIKRYLPVTSRKSDTIWCSYASPIVMHENLAWASRVETLRTTTGTATEVLDKAAGRKEVLEKKAKVFNKLTRYIRDMLDNSSDGARRSDDCDPERETFLTEYVKCGDVNVFKMSTGQIQMNFPDHQKLVISLGAQMLRFIINGKVHVFTREETQAGRINRFGIFLDEKVGEKVDFAAGVLAKWCREGKVCGWDKK